VMENPTLLPFCLISRVKNPVIGLCILPTTLSMRVDFPHLGGPVTRIFLLMIRNFRNDSWSLSSRTKILDKSINHENTKNFFRQDSRDL
jgi:hypothetical protein